MQKPVTLLLFLLLPVFAALFARNGHHLTGFFFSGLSLIIYIIGVGIFSLQVLIRLFKNDKTNALTALFHLLVALSMILLTTILMIGTNPADKTRNPEIHASPSPTR